MPALTLAQLQARVGGTLRGDGAVTLTGAAALETARADQLSFVLSRQWLTAARDSRAGALVVAHELAHELPGNLLVAAHPHACFARALALLQPEPQPAAGIHPLAWVAPDARLAEDVAVAAGASVDAGAEIGAGVRIGAGSQIGPGVRIGAHSRLHAGVRVQHGCVVGERCILHPGCVIGADGFGLAREGDAWVKVPQVGRVILGDEVEIGANTTIDRGALDDTVIEHGAKLDNLIHIAHNCRIGAHTAIAACVGIAGSTRIGAHCMIGGAAMIIGHLEICDHVTISAGSFVAKDIRAPGIYTSVQPLMPHAEWRRNAAHLRHLDALAERLKNIEKRLEDKEAS